MFDIDVPGKIQFKESETLSPGDSFSMFDTREYKTSLPFMSTATVTLLSLFSSLSFISRNVFLDCQVYIRHLATIANIFQESGLELNVLRKAIWLKKNRVEKDKEYLA